MNYCQYCGARLGDGPYCGNCGRAVPQDGDTRTLPVGESAEETGDPAADATGTAETGTGAGTATAEQARPSNPFADIGFADYVRDIVALVLLIATFSMPWDATETAADKLHVVLATLLAMAALTLPYLKRGHVLPARTQNADLRIARGLAVVPYLVVVAVTVILDIASEGSTAGGVGVGVAFGLAGVLLAAQSRDCELDDGPVQAQVWRLITVALGVLVAALTVVRLVFVLSDVGADPEWTAVAAAVLEPLIFLAVLAVPVIGLLRRDAVSRVLTVGLGAVALVLAFWRLSEASELPEVLSMRTDGPGELFWLAVAAAVVAAGMSTALHPVPASQLWLGSAAGALGLAALVTGLAAVFWVLVIVSVDEGRGTTITLLVLTLLAFVAALVGRNSLRAGPAQGRVVALAVAGLLVVLGIIQLAVEAAGPLGRSTTGALAVTTLFVVAALVVLALTVPRSVREELGTLPLGGRQRS